MRNIRLFVVATHGISEDTLHAMRAACDKQGVRARKIMEKERADAEKKRTKRQREEGGEEEEAGGGRGRRARAPADSDVEESSGEEPDARMDVDPPSPPAPGSPQLMTMSQEAQFVHVSQAVPTRITIRMPSQQQQPPPAKKRRIGEADAILAMASQLEQMDEDEPMVEDLRAAATDPVTWQRYALEMLALESKYVEAEYETLRTTPTKARKLFAGSAVPLVWPHCYSFLHAVDAGHYRDHLLLPYYRELPENIRGDIPNDEVSALLLTDDQSLALYRNAWTVAAAIASGPVDAPHFRHVASYYPGLAWATNSDDALKQIGRLLPALLRCGAPAPLAFPATSHAVRVRPPFLFPELLLEQPLPFPTHQTADPADFSTPLADLVSLNPPVFGNLRRASLGEVDDAAIYEGTFNLLVVGRDADTAHLATRELVEPARRAREEDDRKNAAFLALWATKREHHIKEQLVALAKEYKGGRYPGLLYPDRGGNLERAMVHLPLLSWLTA